MDRIAECTAHDLERFVPFRVEGTDVGWVRRDRLDALAPLRDDAGQPVFDETETHVRLSGRYGTTRHRSAVMSGVVEHLQGAGVIPRMGHELYPVVTHFGAPPFLAMERSAMPAFGARAFGVHMHGFVRRADGLHMWIAHRSRTKATFPGMLDNLVAGGQPLGLSLEDNLVKECAEEADIPAALARQAVPTGAVSYRMEIDRGLRNDTLFLYDLELPEDFVPRNTDGEVESFELWPIRDVLQRIESASDFKFNCNLTLMDFLLRHGVLDATHPEYAAVREALPSHARSGAT
jgi:8-oxo-dGTP pyrophosphatase MutT (NUDIX family)